MPKVRARELLREERTVQQIASWHGAHPNHFSRWNGTAREELTGVFDQREWSRPL